MDHLQARYDIAMKRSNELRKIKVQTAKLSHHLKETNESILTPHEAEIFERIKTAIIRTTESMKKLKKKGANVFRQRFEKELSALMPNRDI